MSLWGATDADESKPKNLTTAEKKLVFASTRGWVQEPNNVRTGSDNASGQPEVLVAMRKLTTKLGAATITSCEFVTTAWDASAGGTLQARVRWNEAVDVVEGGSGLKLNVNSTPDGGSATSHTLRYASGTGTNELTFTKVIGAANSAIQAGDILSIPEEDLVKAGSTSVKDAGTSTVSEVGITAAQGTAAGTVTATAS